LFRRLIRFYQLVISPMAPGNCRYYPSCSEYALIQFEKRNPLVALAVSTLRILRCNQLFEGGFDYPVIPFEPTQSPLAPETRKGFVPHYYLVPKQKGRALIIKKLKENN